VMQRGSTPRFDGSAVANTSVDPETILLANRKRARQLFRNDATRRARASRLDRARRFHSALARWCVRPGSCRCSPSALLRPGWFRSCERTIRSPPTNDGIVFRESVGFARAREPPPPPPPPLPLPLPPSLLSPWPLPPVPLLSATRPYLSLSRRVLNERARAERNQETRGSVAATESENERMPRGERTKKRERERYRDGDERRNELGRVDERNRERERERERCTDRGIKRERSRCEAG